MSAGRWHEAMVALDQALALEPNFIHACGFKAIVCSREGHPDEAHKLMARARELEPQLTLALWESRLRCLFFRFPTWDEMLQHLRMAWAATESAA